MDEIIWSCRLLLFLIMALILLKFWLLVSSARIFIDGVLGETWLELVHSNEAKVIALHQSQANWTRGKACLGNASRKHVFFSFYALFIQSSYKEVGNNQQLSVELLLKRTTILDLLTIWAIPTTICKGDLRTCLQSLLHEASSFPTS